MENVSINKNDLMTIWHTQQVPGLIVNQFFDPYMINKIWRNNPYMVKKMWDDEDPWKDPC